MAFIANQGIAPKGDRYDRSALVNDVEGKLYKRTEKGDFIYSSNNLETGSIGLNKYGNACISPVYSIFHPSGIADSDFLGRRLVRKDFIHEMVKWRQGVIYGQWRIHEADFLRLNIVVPSANEQRLIGKLLDNLDSLITLHQRKHDQLATLKKSLLDKMFPKPGSDVPELRFAGFAEPWEQRKLGELVDDIATGKSVNSYDGIVGPGDVGIMKTSCVSYDTFDAGETKRVLPEEQSLVACPVEAKTLIVSRMNTPDRVGACGFVADDWPNLFLPDRLWRVRLRNSVEPYLVYVLLTSDGSKEVLRGMASGTSGSMHNIPKESFLDMELALPTSLEEQSKIAKQFASLDNLITLHQREPPY